MATRRAEQAVDEQYDAVLSDEAARQWALLETGAASLTFREYVDRVKVDSHGNPTYKWYEYAVRLARVLQRVADDMLDRVLIFAPPRLGKSELVSRLFSAYYLYRHPSRWVALASYGADLARDLSRDARDNYMAALGVEGSLESKAVRRWLTGSGGGMWAAGVRGAATGRGSHLFIVDDPVKDDVEARSEIIQSRNIGWNDKVVDTRLEPRGARIVIQTRWDMKDLSGELLARENGEAREFWHIVCFEAEKLPDGYIEWPATCTIEPDWRKPGEGVCYERLSRRRMELLKRRDSDTWNSLYQQNPVPREGGIFKRWWFEIVDRGPAEWDIIATIRWWDQAATQDGGDYTSGVKMCRTRSGIWYVLDVMRGQWASGVRDEIIKSVAQIDGKGVYVGTAVDPGSAGKDAEAHFRRMMSGYKIITDRESGDKVTRAEPFASEAKINSVEESAAGVGRVKLLRGAWNEPYLAVMTSFPHGAFDDDVDASANAYNKLAAMPDRKNRTYTPYTQK